MNNHNSPLKQQPQQQGTSQYWSRFMNKRVVDKAYVPTAHEHAANCLTHEILVIPACIAAQILVSNSMTHA
ncbi:unnamed protein product [Didymodactylos carnosus]|uniref:Uncharacterized protein n=1 Tax=Didymodactylos carnosus TaxID=1234261 RepID=A0A813VLK7_9BILA|nr:unnamed protein product [Didymodactylos carnosus]CAF0838397.1 unnamed protein product [Didymodactylos carnosus]CAF3575618.1 unnamed protein product [Didymodactylos carnosus]CAF3625686.1 unnamed protein product [Didymodactylos carnosus]